MIEVFELLSKYLASQYPSIPAISETVYCWEING